MPKEYEAPLPNQKTILVLSDDDRVARVIELILRRGDPPDRNVVVDSPNRSGPKPATDSLCLVILAISTVTEDPMVALSRVSLDRQIRRIPVLVISNGPFHPNPDHRIFHLGLPFDFDEFSEQVHILLASEPSDTRSTAEKSGHLQRDQERTKK